jgi:hypothetical protein
MNESIVAHQRGILPLVEEDMAEWIQRQYTKGEIDRAGARLIPWWKFDVESLDDLHVVYLIVQNWRTSHAMPLLAFRMSLQNRARRVEPNAIVAQRLKRFSSVLNKLIREPTMQLSQMQDLGGCRAIVSNMDALNRLYALYQEDQGNQGLFHAEGAMKCYDYITNPKSDGYRGIHVVGRYRARNPKNARWNGQRIEIQLRSQLQHAFATAVETVTTFIREPLKFGAGPDEWRRFFSLMGSALAIREGTNLVPGTPSDQTELVRELRKLTRTLNVRQRLRNWTRAIRQLPRQNTADNKWLLLVLDVPANEISVRGYTDRRRAAKRLAEIEKTSRAKGLDAVLVWVGAISNLRRAYPNYYADTRAFVKALNVALHSSTGSKTEKAV